MKKAILIQSEVMVNGRNGGAIGDLERVEGEGGRGRLGFGVVFVRRRRREEEGGEESVSGAVVVNHGGDDTG